MRRAVLRDPFIRETRPVDPIPFPPLRDYPEYVQFGTVAPVYLLSVIYLEKPRY